MSSDSKRIACHPSSFGPWAMDPVWVAMVASLAPCAVNFSLMELFGGLGTAFIAFRALGVAASVLYYCDKNPALLHWLSQLHSTIDAIHIGDILTVAVASLPSVDFLVAGPPCPPWSVKGLRGSWNDVRAEPFRRTISIIVDQVKRGILKCFIIENVEGFLQKQNDGTVPVQEVLDVFKNALPLDWSVDYKLYNSRNFGLPQNRPRVYIVGRRSNRAVVSLPRPLVRFQRQPVLQDVIQLDAPLPKKGYFFGQCGRGYSAQQQRNLGVYKVWYTVALSNTKFLGSVAAFAYDRTPASRTDWSVTRHVDFTECLTASGPLLHFLSLGDSGQSIDRSVLVSERALLQGFPIGYVSDDLFSDEAIVAVGNAMSVPVVASVLYRELAYLLGLPPIAPSQMLMRPGLQCCSDGAYFRERSIVLN